MSFQLTGRYIADYGVKQITDKFKKREFVIEWAEEYNGNAYTKYAKLQLTNNKCDLLNNVAPNSMITVDFSVEGTRYEKDGQVNYITNLNAFKIQPAQQQQQQQQYNQGFGQQPQQQATGFQQPAQQQQGGFGTGFQQPQQPQPQQGFGTGFQQQPAQQQQNNNTGFGTGFQQPGTPENVDNLPF